jgi:2-C-methyl-D-erythritol 4-phosphate cytidylyltransferase
MLVTAVVVGGDRTGGLDPLTPVGGSAMVAHAVRCLLDTGWVERVLVLDRPERAGVITEACADLPVDVRAGFPPPPWGTHGAQRADPRTGDAVIPSGPGIVLLHDAARPLAPAELAVAVVEGVRAGHPAVVPVLPLADTVKQVDAAGIVRGSPDRAVLRHVQTPQAIRRDLLPDGPLLDAALRLAGRRPGIVHTVPGHPLAFGVRAAWDLELAELLLARGVQRAGRRGD